MAVDPQKPKGEYEDIERAIEKEVKEAVHSIAGAVQSVVSSVSETVRQSSAEGAQQFGEKFKQTLEKTRAANAQRPSHPYKNQTQSADSWYNGGTVRGKKRPVNYAKKVKSARSDASGNLFVAAVLAAVTFVSGSIVPGIVGVFFAVGSVLSFFRSKRLQRLLVYTQLLEGRSYCTVQELSAASDRNPHAVRKDLKKFIGTGELTGMFMALDGSRVFTNRTAYNAYMAHSEEKSARAAQPQPVQTVQTEPPDPQTEAEDAAFLTQLKKQKAMVDDAAVLEQVERIEAQTERIFAWVKTHPKSEASVQRFTSYYLPTILKLLQTYNDIESQADESAVAGEIKENICGILYTINTAFQSLQDTLLQDTALDVSAEISALETVLASEGLTKSDFAPKF